MVCLRIAALACLVLLLSLSTPIASAQLTYTILDVPGASTQLSGINNNGVIAGDYSGGSFTWNSGVFSYFSVPGALYTQANGINDSNVVVGYYSTSATDRVGFIYDGVSFKDLQYPGVPITEAFGINNAGLIAGFEAPDTADYTGMTFDGTKFRTFKAGANSTWAYGVNNLGDVVGTEDSGSVYEGFIRSKGKNTIFAPPGSIFASALAINDNRIVVGTYETATTRLSCFYMKNGKFKTFSIPQASSTVCTGISNSGVIVGSAFNENNGVSHGFYTSPVTDADFK